LVQTTLALTLLAGTAAAQTEPLDRDLAKVRSDLAAAQKELTQTKQALEKSQKDQAEAQVKLADATRTAEHLRKELDSEKAHHHKTVAKLHAAIKEAAAKLVVTSKDDVQAKVELKAAQKTLAQQPNLPVTVVVTLPADAQLTFDDLPTTSIGGSRLFVSPPVSVGPTFCYMLKAEIMRDGKAVTVHKHVEVHAGERIEVSLTFPVTSSVVQP